MPAASTKPLNQVAIPGLHHVVMGLAMGIATLTVVASPERPSSCSSDGQHPPNSLVDRFISADCAACWVSLPTLRAGPHTVALDWIVPGTQKEDAPLSAAASRDASLRLQALNLPAPATQSSATHSALPTAGWRLRVAHGPALGGYIGASIELRMSGPAGPPVKAWLALVETLPAGTEGSPVQRNLIRNVLMPAWDGHEMLSKKDKVRFYESRPMSIPAGAQPERLRVIGWVEDAQGRIRVIAQSQCTSAGQRW
jgi:hypothetical protein